MTMKLAYKVTQNLEDHLKMLYLLSKAIRNPDKLMMI